MLVSLARYEINELDELVRYLVLTFGYDLL
jgi:hypothetical protein